MSSNGQILGTVVGAVVGFFVPVVGVALGASIGGAIGGAIDPPDGPKIVGPRLSDLSQQGSSYGAAIPRVYGSSSVMGNIFWIENNALKESSHTESSGGSKGGGGGSETKTYSYSATFALGICEGPIAGVRRIWISGKLIYDAGSDDMGTIQSTNTAAYGIRIYPGTDTQSPDPRMQASLGVANTPAYRGLAYIVFDDLELADYGNTLMGAQIKVEIVGAGQVNTYVPTNRSMPSSSTWKRIVWNGDKFVAVCSSPLSIATSRDGITWATRSHSLGNPSAGGLAWGNGVFVLVTFGPLAGVSKDGVVWTNASMPEVGVWTDVCWNGDQFVAVRNGPTYATSYNGYGWISHVAPSNKSWSFIKSIGSITLFSSSNASTYCLSKNNGGFVELPLPESIVSAIAVSNGSTIVIFSPNTNRLIYTSDGENWTGQYFPHANTYSAGWDGEYWLVIANGQIMYRSSDLVNWVSCCTLAHAQSTSEIGWNEAVICILPYGQTAVTVVKRKIVSTPPTLSSIIESECLKSGLLVSSDIDVTSLTDTVRGYKISATAAIRSNIEPLQGAWPFDVVQSGYKVKFKRRGGASVATIPANDLGAGTDGEAPAARFVESRDMDTQLPARVNISYMDAGREYDIGEQYAERLNTGSVNVRALEMPIVLTADEAVQKSEILLYMYWLERYDVAIKLPPTYARLEPADVITVQAESGTYELRLTDVNYLSNGIVECAAKLNNAAGYTSTASSDTGSLPVGTIAAKVPSTYVLLDIPLMIDDYDTAGFPSAMAGVSSGWTGGTIFKTSDAGQTWALMNGFTRQSVIGIGINSVAAPAEHRMVDKASALNVYLYGGESLSSITEAQMLNGSNHFAYGDHGRWEIIAAQNCTLQADGSYTLTDLLRGRYGTEWAMTGHLAGDTVVLLDTNRLQFASVNLNAIGLALDYRGITAGKTIDTDTNRAFTYAGVNLECLSPVYLNGNRHPSTNDWSLDWVRRTRVGGDWRDNVDATLGEASEAYEVEIYSSGTYATLKRTITGLTTPAAAYSSANQVTDFGTNQATLYVKIYQLSANVGRGYPLTQAITR